MGDRRHPRRHGSVNKNPWSPGLPRTGALAACSPSSSRGSAGATSADPGGATTAPSFLADAYRSEKTKNIGIVREAASSEDVDVVVVGSGMGGHSAAIMVAEQAPGTKVVMLEKNPALGGNTNFAEALMTAENLSGPEAYAYAMSATLQHNFIPDPMLWYARALEQGDDCDWVMGKHQIPMEKPEGAPAFFYAGGNGASAIKALPPQAEDLGVDIRINSRATALVTADEYTVTGVQYEDESGEVVQLNAKAVVLATGGFGNNLELLHWFGSQDVEKLAGVGSGQDGDGQLMVMQTAHGKAAHICVATFNNNMGTGAEDVAAFDSWLATAACWQLSALYVNQDGTRFCDESAAAHSGMCKMVESQGYAFAICDDTAIDRWASGEWTRSNMMWRETKVGQPLDLRGELDEYRGRDWYHEADSAQALGESIAAKVPSFNVIELGMALPVDGV